MLTTNSGDLTKDPLMRHKKAETRPPLAREPGFGLELTPKS